MRKILPVIILVLCLVLSGCGGSETPSGNISPSDASPATPPTGTTSPAEPEQPEAPAEPEQPEAPAEPEQPDEGATVSMGRIEGGIYTNSYAGYGVELDSSWVFYSAEELQVVPENVEELFEGSKLSEIAEFTAFTDMMAENVENLTTMNIQYQQLTMQERLSYALLGESETIDEVLAMQDILIDAYTQAGIVVSEMGKVQVDFCGQQRYGLYTVATMQDVPYYILQVFDYDLGSYGVVLTVSSFIDDRTAELLDLFYAVD